jgi:DNA helicase II / ATP-dependent DNA helicase PcrA
MELNKQQKAILEHLTGQSLVVACPGSGKTTTMMARTNALVESGVPERTILVMTFTKDAAENMAKKYKKEYGSNHIDFSTIHSVCFKILRESAGYTVNQVLTELEKWEYFGKACRGMVSFNEMEELIRGLITEISYIKNKMTGPENYEPECCRKDDFIRLYYGYEEMKRQIHKVDYDDMLLITRELLLGDEELTEIYRSRYQYIMVDEYQDTNVVQADIIYRLAGEDGNLCVVGDDDQSIYGFRSADSSIMLNFPNVYPNCKQFNLDTNYRSKKEIIRRAGTLIQYNRVRFDKKFKGFQKGDANISCQGFESMASQHKAIAQILKELYKADIESFQDTAVLYRTNRQNEGLVSFLLKENIPFTTSEPIHDYHDDKVFLDIKTYYRLANGVHKKGDVQSILNRPSRYLKGEIFKYCSFNKKEMLRCCNECNNVHSAKSSVLELFDDVKTLEGKKKPYAFIHYLFDVMGYKKSYIEYMKFMGKDESETENALSIIREESKDFQSMEEWFAYAEQFKEKLKKRRKSGKGVRLSTYHAAKGLEWENVFLIDCNMGFAPYTKALEQDEITVDEDGCIWNGPEVEEERRLFYVAFTRAKTNLILTYAKNGGDKELEPSEFLYELELLKHKKNKKRAG